MELPIALTVSDLDSGPTVVLSLIFAVLTEAQSGVPPIIQLWPEGWLIMGTNHGFEIEWCQYRWIGMRAARPPWFDVSFGDSWVISHLPSLRGMGLVLSGVCFSTQEMAPDNVNVASLTSPRLSPSNDCHP